MVPRPLAPARAIRSRACADVIQPCSLNHIRFVKGRVARFCVWANCRVSPFNSIVIETIESTDAGNGNNPIVIDYSLELLL